ncbi:MAG: YHS domain-containing protein [Candidatus Omnitrophica bacterium]|nr:YHS domain-containing protein [Candidatus Omnitrophota bacterium]
MRLFFILALLGFLIIAHSLLVLAQSATEKLEATTNITEPQDIGNKICPVSGEKIDEKMKATYEYQGKIYNFCCSMCIDEFKKDPEKYIKKLKETEKYEHKGYHQQSHAGYTH